VRSTQFRLPDIDDSQNDEHLTGDICFEDDHLHVRVDGFPEGYGVLIENWSGKLRVTVTADEEVPEVVELAP